MVGFPDNSGLQEIYSVHWGTGKHPRGGWQPPTLSGRHDDSGAGQAKMLRVAWEPQFSGQWEFRDPKFEVPTIYKAYERAM